MRKDQVSQYYFFGTTMRYLQDAMAGWTIRGEGLVLNNVTAFFGHLQNMNLPVTTRASHRLIGFKNELETTASDKLSSEQADELSEIMREIRFTLDAEIPGIEAYITSPKRFDISLLSGDIASLFSPGAFEQFPDIAKYDFIEAGKCIVFERATAAAFHVLRGTEANLRHYYKSMVKQNRISSEMWGPLVQDLRRKNKTKKYAALNNHLDNIRISYRNPTQHPEAIYDVHEAQDLLSVCIDVNNKMFKVLADA